MNSPKSSAPKTAKPKPTASKTSTPTITKIPSRDTTEALDIINSPPFIPSWLGQLDKLYPSLQKTEKKFGAISSSQREMSQLISRCQENITLLLEITGGVPTRSSANTATRSSANATAKNPANTTARNSDNTSAIRKYLIRGGDAIAQVVDLLTCDDVIPTRYSRLFFLYGTHEYRDTSGAPLPGIECDTLVKNAFTATEFPPDDPRNDLRRRNQYVRHFLIPRARFCVCRDLQELILTPAEFECIDAKTIGLLSDLKKYLSGIPQQTCFYTIFPSTTQTPYTILPSRLETYRCRTSNLFRARSCLVNPA